MEQLTLLPLVQDLQLPSVTEGKTDLEVNLWLNTHEMVSDAHYDSYNGVLCVVHGTKHVKLWSPSAAVRANSLFSEAYNGVAPTHTLPPPAISVTLKKGEALFIPEGWWHEVSSRANTAAVSIWWKGVDQSLLRTKAQERLDGYLCRSTFRRLVERRVREKVDLICTSNSLRYSPHSTEDIAAVESGDSELIAELMRPLAFVNQLAVLATLTADALRRVLLSVQNAGALYDFLQGLEPLAAFTVMDKLSRDDQGSDNSQFYKDLWSREEHSKELIDRLTSLKRAAMEAVARDVVVTFFE